MNPDMRKVIMYLEKCLVEDGGFFIDREIGQAGMYIADQMKREGLIDYSRILPSTSEVYLRRGVPHTHHVMFTSKAWEIAHMHRRARAEKTTRTM